MSRVAATTWLRYNAGRRARGRFCDGSNWSRVSRARLPGISLGGGADRVKMNLLVSFLTLCGWASWGYIVLFVDPGVPLAPLAFYGTLFVAVTCTLAQLLAGRAKGEVDTNGSSSAPNLGHAVALSTLLLFALWLQSLRMLMPLNVILLGATFLLIELGFFLGGSRRRPRARRRTRRQPASETGLAGER